MVTLNTSHWVFVIQQQWILQNMLTEASETCASYETVHAALEHAMTVTDWLSNSVMKLDGFQPQTIEQYVFAKNFHYDLGIDLVISKCKRLICVPNCT